MRNLLAAGLALSTFTSGSHTVAVDAPQTTLLRVNFDNATRPDSVPLTSAIRLGLERDSTLTILERPVPPGETTAGARFAVMVTFLSVGQQVLVELRGVDVQSNRILAHEAVRGVRTSLADSTASAAQRLARKLAPPR